MIRNILLLSAVNTASVINTDNKMTTEIWRVHILWIFQITKIIRAKSPIQNCLSSGFQERVGVTYYPLESLILQGFRGDFPICGNHFATNAYYLIGNQISLKVHFFHSVEA